MTQQFEALAALDASPGIGYCSQHEAALRLVRAALESAQREARAWVAIEAWCKVFDLMRRHIVIMPGKTGYFWELRHGERVENESFVAFPDRAAALDDAAEWCRAEMAKS